MATIGENIKRLRLNSLMTQQQLADAIGRTRQWVAYIESGKVEITAQMLMEVGKVFNKTPQELMNTSEVCTKVETDVFQLMPYLLKAEQWQLKAIACLLGVPNTKEVDS